MTSPSKMTQVKTAVSCLVFLGVFLGLLGLSVQEYKCMPYEPPDECKLSRYEVHIHDVTQKEKRIIGIAEGACVYAIGHGKSRRFVMTDAQFTSANRTDFMDSVEFPAAQSLACEVR